MIAFRLFNRFQKYFRKRVTESQKAISIGFYLAQRQVRRSSKWTTVLIIFVMTLTFLNLVVISGILVGLIEGASVAVKSQYMADVIVTPLADKKNIEESPAIIATIKTLPWVESMSARYTAGVEVEANYKERIKSSDRGDTVTTNGKGIDPIAEDAVTNLSKYIIEGSYLEPGDYDQILVGSLLLRKYFDYEAPGFSTLKYAKVGEKVRITINDQIRDVTIKGIVKTKVDEISRSVFFVDTQFRSLIGRNDYSVNEIAIKLKPGTSPQLVKNALIENGYGDHAKIQTYEDAEPKFVKDLKSTFALLGNVIGSIGLAVASITIFIVIFINAITRRKFIGILKGIGIHSSVIEYAYIFQSLFYALSGTILGMLIVFLVLKPFFAAHPINFPFSDGILVATLAGTMTRAGLLFIATLIAGYIPARIVVKQNTLDAILGR
ncbi:MAG: ABC transporter permease [Candidatus Paceibacterota bacterium]|jgi:ABC-type lipoprotein release transport system permease subunit